MASISFTDEASESFAYFLQHIAGWTVEVTPAEGERYELPFDAVVIGSGTNEVDDYFAVKLQAFNEDTGEGEGELFTIVVEDLQVY